MILAIAAAAALAPPLDRPLRLVTEQVRNDSGVVRRFVAERLLTFRRDTDGLVVEAKLVRLDAVAEAEIARNYRLTTGGLLDRVIRFRLAGDRIVGVDEQDAVWAAMIAPFARVTPPRNRTVPDTARPGASLMALPPEQRLRVLAGAVQPVIAGDDAGLAPGQQTVTVPGPAPLSGTRTVTRDAGRLVIVTAAASPDGAASLTRRRVVDPATGLVLSERETLVRRLNGAEQTTTTTTTLSIG